MKEIKATAPTPQDWIELVRENERLRTRLEKQERKMRLWRGLAYNVNRMFLETIKKSEATGEQNK